MRRRLRHPTSFWPSAWLVGGLLLAACGGRPPDASGVAATCALPWGATLASGQSVTAYRSSPATCGTTCASETRTCSDGLLSGDFADPSCTADPGTPTVTLSAADALLPVGYSTVLTWSSTCATDCTASGAWSGARAIAGTQGTVALAADATFALTCSNSARQAQGSAAVGVRPWVDAVGEGNAGETCAAWLARTGQAGLLGSPPRTVNYLPSGAVNWATESTCQYVVTCDGGGTILPVLAPDAIPTGNPCAQAQQNMTSFRPVSAAALLGYSYRTQTRR